MNRATHTSAIRGITGGRLDAGVAVTAIAADIAFCCASHAALLLSDASCVAGIANVSTAVGAGVYVTVAEETVMAAG